MNEGLKEKIDLQRAELDVETEKLNATLKELEEALRVVRFGVIARVPIDDVHWLGWGKFDNRWCLTHIFSDNEEPLVNANRETRLRAAGALNRLVEALAEAQLVEVGRVRSAEQLTRRVLSQVRQLPLSVEDSKETL